MCCLYLVYLVPSKVPSFLPLQATKNLPVPRNQRAHTQCTMHFNKKLTFCPFYYLRTTCCTWYSISMMCTTFMSHQYCGSISLERFGNGGRSDGGPYAVSKSMSVVVLHHPVIPPCCLNFFDHKSLMSSLRSKSLT